jgi:hypothetical protein
MPVITDQPEAGSLLLNFQIASDASRTLYCLITLASVNISAVFEFIESVFR